MNEKPFKLDMPFSEALARLSRVPKTAIDARKPSKAQKTKKRLSKNVRPKSA